MIGKTAYREIARTAGKTGVRQEGVKKGVPHHCEKSWRVKAVTKPEEPSRN